MCPYTNAQVTLAGSRVPSRLLTHTRDSPVQRSDDSAGPGTPVKSRSEARNPTLFKFTLTSIQPPCLCGAIRPPAVTHVQPPHKNHGKVHDLSHDRLLKRYIIPNQGIVGNINWLNQPCRSPRKAPIPKLMLLRHPPCLHGGLT